MTIDWKVIAKDLAILLAITGFIAFLNPFDAAPSRSFVVRWAYWSGLALAGSVIGSLTVRMSLRLLPDAPWFAHIFTASPIIALFVTPAVQGLGALTTPASNLPSPVELYGLVLVLSIAMTALILVLGRAGVTQSSIPARQVAPDPATQPRQEDAIARFLKRLPPRYRDSRLLALSAEDHYLRVHTSLGAELILMRMSDAVAELGDAEGMQVHRSWWVARSAATDLRRDGSRTVLALDGAPDAPVSRANVKRLRDAGWF